MLIPKMVGVKVNECLCTLSMYLTSRIPKIRKTLGTEINEQQFLFNQGTCYQFAVVKKELNCFWTVFLFIFVKPGMCFNLVEKQKMTLVQRPNPRYIKAKT